MLDLALQFLGDEISGYLHARTGSDAVKCKPSKLVDEAGKYAVVEDSLGVSLIRVAEERTFKAQVPEATYVDGRHVILEPPLKLNLHVLVAAHFKLYDQALKYLSHVLTFFQAHPAFTPAEYPALEVRIEKLLVELESLTYEQLNQIWAFIGGKHLPSVVYQVRLVTLQDQAPPAIRPPITTVQADLGRR